jgi:hypothetical protein
MSVHTSAECVCLSMYESARSQVNKQMMMDICK